MARKYTQQHQSGGQGTAGAGPREFTEWIARRCQEQAQIGPAIDRARPVRTSSANVTLWQTSATTSFAAADRTDPDVAQALALGFDVVRRDAIGETTRLELGDRVFVLRMRHAPGGRGRKQLGVVLHVGRTFFVYLLSSARANNLEAETDDRRGNAATELLATVVRRMTAVGRELDDNYRPQVFAREHARIVRDEQHGADLKATFVACRVIAHTPQTSDLTRPGDAQHFSFGSMLSAASADANILGMNRSEIVIQADGGFNEDIRRVPFTHGPTVRCEVDHRTGVKVVTSDTHRIAHVEDVAQARAQLRQLVDKILEDRHNGTRPEPGTDWAAVGDLMAALDMPSRLGQHLKRNIRLRNLPTHTRVKAAKSLFSKRWVAGWRDGEFEQLVPVKIAMDLDLTHLGVREVTTPDGRPAYLCRINMPMPPGGWGVSDEEWAEVLRRRNPMSTQPRVYTGTVLPLAGTPEWDDGTDNHPATCQYDIVTANSRYLLRSRPIREANDSDGGRRGWDGSTVTRIGGVRAAEWHQDIARAMRDALESLDCSAEPVVLTPARGPRQVKETRIGADVTHERQSALEEQLAKAQLQRRGAVDARNEARGRHATGATDDTAEDLEEAEDDLRRTKEQVRHLSRELKALTEATSPARAADPHATEVGVHTATAEFVAAALEKCESAAPGWLQEACQVLLTDVRLTPHQQPGQRPKLQWTANLSLNTTDDAGRTQLVDIPLAGQIIDRTNARDGVPVLNGPEGWAWAYFYRGLDLATLGKDADVDGSGKKNSYLYRGLHKWLDSAVPAVIPHLQMRTAALDCPVPATRRVMWSAVTGDTAALSGVDQRFAQHIRQVYGGASAELRWGWCGDTHQLTRNVARLLLEGGGTAPLFDLADQLNVAPNIITALARVNGASTRQGAAAKPARTALSPFTKNWNRGANCLPADQRQLALRPCPHQDCPKRLQGGQGYASHVLLVPETEIGFGVLCPDCRRLPVTSMAGVRFPMDYFRPWSGRFGYGSHAGARAYPGTHIDPALTDPGPGAPLPDTGAKPRPETVVNKPGNYMAKHLRGRPLGGHRVLPLGLRPADHDLVAAEGERLGGRLAVKVTRTLTYVVVADRDAMSDPRARRAAEFGAEVMTVGEFRTRGRANWASPSQAGAA